MPASSGIASTFRHPPLLDICPPQQVVRRGKSLTFQWTRRSYNDAKQLYSMFASDANSSPVRNEFNWEPARYAAATSVLRDLNLLTPVQRGRDGRTTLSVRSTEAALNDASTELSERASHLMHDVNRHLAVVHGLALDFTSTSARSLRLDSEVLLPQSTEPSESDFHDFIGLASTTVYVAVNEPWLSGRLMDQLSDLSKRRVAVKAVIGRRSDIVTEEPLQLSDPSGDVTAIRQADPLPFSVVLRDHDSVLAWGVESSRDQASALAWRNGPALHLIRELLESWWNQSVTLMRSPTSPGEGLRDSSEEALLSMLASGLTDESVARRLGVSERTVRRRVSLLAARLDAGSRFQAGANAARAGLLNEPTP